ncbi:MAG: response regulator, partial [Propionibacteriaceae bacterium]|nr:response regulator [Propionibacteriaceae bacterium]
MARRILVVDDEPAIRTVLAAYLEADGFTVVHADTGAEALRRTFDAADPVDLVLLDVGLPDLDGLEVLTTIRARSEVSVILVTARSEEVDKLV